MHRFRSWTLDPPEWRTQRNRALSLEGGDGSSLNVDFTTGVLDPKITHTRGSNATFINSSGRVQWAAANMFRNTVWGSTSLPTGWLANASNTGTVTYNGDGTITCAATNQIAWIYPNFPYIGTQSGLSYICSFRVVSISGPTLITDILSTGNLTATDYFIDGISVGASPSAPSGNVTGPCVISVRVNATSASWFPRLGVGVQNLSRTATITMSEPHAHPGTVPVPYIANSSTSVENFNTPRFDYNPTTLESNGLLIEGNVTNYSNYSETFPTAPSSGTAWGRLEVTANATLQNSPDGTANAIAFNETTNNAIHRLSHVVTAVAGALTCSVWVKIIDNSAPRRLFMNATTMMGVGALFDIDPTVQTGASGSAVIVSGTATNRAGTWVKYPNGWYRCSIIGTYVASATMYLQLNRASSITATDDTYAGSTSNGLMIWGFQVEAGSGASSYIPTGSSSVTRVNDSVTFNDRNWFTSWKSTWFANYKVFNCAGIPTFFYARSSQDAFNNYLNIVANNTNSLTSVLSRSNSNAVQQWSTNNPLLSITSEFNKCAWVIDDTAKIAHAGVIDYTSTSGRSLPLGSGLSAYEIALNPTVGTSCSMWLRSLKYYPKALNNVELINLTKPTIPNEALSLVFDNTNYDSRIVFDRGTNATFVNSLGLVQWADANMQPNTAFTGITSFAIPGGWGGFVGPDPGGGGTRANFTLISPGTVKCTAGSILATNTCRCFLSTIFSYSLGIPLTIKATVVDKQWSSANLTEFLLWTNSTTSEVTYYKNGVSIGDLSVAQGYTDWTSGDEITLIVVPTAISGVVRVGLGNNNNQPVNSYITFNKFIVLPGRQPQTLSNYYTHSNTGSGYFAPRLDYDPTNTGTLKGLLVENASTNFIQYSSDFTQASTWIPAGTGLIQTNNTTETTAPDGSNTASILARGTSGIYIESTLGTLAANTQVTLSCWLKKRGTNSIGSLAVGTGSAWVASGASIEFNFDNPASSTLINPGNIIRWGYTQYPNNWYRIYMVITTSATPAGAKIRFRVDSPIGVDGYYLWGPQVEENRIMTSYIPTGSALSTIRNAESYYIPTSSWFTNNPYSMDFKYEMNDPSGLFIGRYCGTLALGVGNPRLFIAVNYQGASAAADDGRRAQLFDSGTLNLTPGSYPTTAASNTKLVFGVQSSLTSFMSTTSLINTSTSAALLTGFDRLWIGREASSNRAINGWMKHIKYWSTRLENNQLKYLSGS